MKPPALNQQRTDLMRRVRGSATKPENAVASALRQVGVRYRRNVGALPGRPDFANRRAGWIIFVHGCFWHRHEGCHRTTTPKHNAEFWAHKFRANIERDTRKAEALRSKGLRVITVWECQTNDPDQLRDLLSELLVARRVEGG